MEHLTEEGARLLRYFAARFDSAMVDPCLGEGKIKIQVTIIGGELRVLYAYTDAGKFNNPYVAWSAFQFMGLELNDFERLRNEMVHPEMGAWITMTFDGLFDDQERNISFNYFDRMIAPDHHWNSDRGTLRKSEEKWEALYPERKDFHEDLAKFPRTAKFMPWWVRNDKWRTSDDGVTYWGYSQKERKMRMPALNTYVPTIGLGRYHSGAESAYHNVNFSWTIAPKTYRHFDLLDRAPRPRWLESEERYETIAEWRASNSYIDDYFQNWSNFHATDEEIANAVAISAQYDWATYEEESDFEDDEDDEEENTNDDD